MHLALYVLSLDSVFGGEQELGGPIELPAAHKSAGKVTGTLLHLATSPAAPGCRSRIKQCDWPNQ